jgi:hypothetical protein
MSKKDDREAVFQEGFEAGYAQAMAEVSWTCDDCGNTYESTVYECPNRILDEIGARQRRKEWEKENA